MGRYLCLFTPEHEAELVKLKILRNYFSISPQKKQDFWLSTFARHGRGVDRPLHLVPWLKMRRPVITTRPLGLQDLSRVNFTFLFKANDCSNPFTSDGEMTGVDWLRGFLKIHPNMSLWSKKITAAVHAKGFSKADFSKLFNLLSKATNEHRLTPDTIFKVGETNTAVNPQGKSEVLALNRRSQVCVLILPRRTNTVRAETCCSASDTSTLPGLFLRGSEYSNNFN